MDDARRLNYSHRRKFQSATLRSETEHQTLGGNSCARLSMENSRCCSPSPKPSLEPPVYEAFNVDTPFGEKPPNN